MVPTPNRFCSINPKFLKRICICLVRTGLIEFFVSQTDPHVCYAVCKPCWVMDGWYRTLDSDGSYGSFDERIYTDLNSEHPIDMTRYQVVNQYMGRIGLINSGGPSGDNDIADAVKTAVINKRAGGMGLISGRKAFQKPMKEGVALLNTIQDVYLCEEITFA